MSDTDGMSVDNQALPFMSSLAIAVNSTFSYATNGTLFAAAVPTYTKDYAQRYVVPACQWLDGYVPYWHDGTAGIMSTRLVKALISGLTKQVVGERPIFKTKVDNDEENALSFITKWSDETDFMSAIYNGVGYALAIGTSLVKANVTYKKLNDEVKKEIWWSAHRFDQCFYMANNHGDVIDATFYLRTYTDTRKQQDVGGNGYNQYILVEHRFFHEVTKPVFTPNGDLLHTTGEMVPMVEYQMILAQTQMQKANTFLSNNKGVNYENLPKTVIEVFKRDFGTTRLNEPIELPFSNYLGVEVFKNAHSDLAVPQAQGFGESLIVPIINDCITYEYAEACLLRDAFLGKGVVYLPKQLNMQDMNASMQINNNGILSDFTGDHAIEILKGADPEKQQAMVVQHDLRVEEWQKLKENSLRDIATKWGMSAKILSSYLANAAVPQTATQVDSEDDVSVAFIQLTRSYFIKPINHIIKQTLLFNSKADVISFNFATPSLVNKDRLLQRLEQALNVGLIDEEDAIRTYFTDESEENIKRKIAKAIVRRKEIEERGLQTRLSGDWFNDNEPTDELVNEKDLDGTTEIKSNEN